MLDTRGLFELVDGKSEQVKWPYGKLILCGVPGAFTPGCTNRHLPGFANHMDQLKEKLMEGIIPGQVMFMSTADAYIMHAWNLHHGHPDIRVVGDPRGTFSRYHEVNADYGETMGPTCCRRFAWLLQDGELVKEFSDPFIEGVISEL